MLFAITLLTVIIVVMPLLIFLAMISATNQIERYWEEDWEKYTINEHEKWEDKW